MIRLRVVVPRPDQPVGRRLQQRRHGNRHRGPDQRRRPDPARHPIVSAPLATVVEGDAGQATMHFVLSLTGPDDAGHGRRRDPGRVGDRARRLRRPPPTTVTFAPGTTVKVVDVTVEGDTLDESDYQCSTSPGPPVRRRLQTGPRNRDRGPDPRRRPDPARHPIVLAPLATVAEGDAGHVTMHFVLSLDGPDDAGHGRRRDPGRVGAAPDDYVALRRRP